MCVCVCVCGWDSIERMMKIGIREVDRRFNVLTMSTGLVSFIQTWQLYAPPSLLPPTLLSLFTPLSIKA